MEKPEIQVSNSGIFERGFDLSSVYTAEIVRDESYNKVASIVFQALAVFEPFFEFSASLVFLVIGQIQALTENIKEVIYAAGIAYRDLKLPWIVPFNNTKKTVFYKDKQIELAKQDKTVQNLNPLLRRLYTSLNSANTKTITLTDSSQQDKEIYTSKQIMSYPRTKITIKDESGSQQILVFGRNESQKNTDDKFDVPISDYDSPEIPTSSALKDFTALSSVKWGSQDFGEILAFYNATVIDTSQSSVHKLYVPAINNGIRLLSGNFLPDRSYSLSPGQDLEFELNQRFLPIIEDALKEIEVDFDYANIAFAPYIIKYDGIRYDQEMIVITEQTNLMQFHVAGLKCRVNNEIARLVNGFEIVYLYNDEFFCLGTLLNADENTDSIEKIVIKLR